MAAVALCAAVLAAPPVARADAGEISVRLYAKDPARLRLELEKAGHLVVAQSPGRSLDLVAPRERLDGILEEHLGAIDAVEPRDLRDAYRSIGDYKDPDEVLAFLDQIESAHPRVAAKFDLTPGGLFEGQHLYAMRLAEGEGVTRPAVLFTCQLHAGEVMTTEVCLDIIEYLSTRATADPEVDRWLSKAEVWVVPMANPDGVAYAMAVGGYTRLNRNHACPVDLDRNFAWTWDACDGASPACGPKDYRGVSPASEPEVLALQALAARLRPDYLLDYHSYGERILYPGGCGAVADQDELARIAGGLRSVLEADSGGLDYVAQAAGTGSPVSGTWIDECHGLYGTRSFAIELNRQFVPADPALRDQTVERQRAGWQFLLWREAAPRVRGQVTEAETGAPLQAKVAFHAGTSAVVAEETKADAQGRYELPLPRETGGYLVVSAPGRRASRIPLQVGMDDLQADVALQPGNPSNRPPVIALAEATLVVDERSAVVLDARASTDPDGDALDYRWEQVGGAAVELSNPLTGRTHFVAPPTESVEDLSFIVEVSDGQGASSALVRVSVRKAWDRLLYCPDSSHLLSYGTSVVSPIDLWPENVLGWGEARLHFDGAVGETAVSLTSPTGRRVATGVTPGEDGTAALDLTAFAGEQAGGRWTLEVSCDYRRCFLSWELRLQFEPQVTDGPALEGQTGDCKTQCADLDGDGYLGWGCGGSDCDDHDAWRYPGASEACNGVDDDCDGATDEDCREVSSDSGCGCSAPGPGAPVLAWLLALGSLARRRRPSGSRVAL